MKSWKVKRLRTESPLAYGNAAAVRLEGGVMQRGSLANRAVCALASLALAFAFVPLPAFGALAWAEEGVVAKIGDVEYDTYEEACANLQDGQTLVILGLDEEAPFITFGEFNGGPGGTFFLDLNGSALEAMGVEVYDGADVTIQNGYLEGDATVYGGKLTIADSATVFSAGVENYVESQTVSSTLVINGRVGSITDGEFEPYNINATFGMLEINEGAEVGEIEISAGSPVVNIKGGSIQEVSIAGDSPELNISGGTINTVTIGQGSGTASLNVTGGAIERLDVLAQDSEVTITGGTFGSDVSEYLTEGVVQDESGTVGANAYTVTFKNWDEEVLWTIAVDPESEEDIFELDAYEAFLYGDTAGTDDETLAFCVPAWEDEDGGYEGDFTGWSLVNGYSENMDQAYDSVELSWEIIPAGLSGDATYFPVFDLVSTFATYAVNDEGSLADAISRVNAGDHIKLFADVALTDSVAVPDGVVLDLNEHTIVAAEGYALTVSEDGKTYTVVEEAPVVEYTAAFKKASYGLTSATCTTTATVSRVDGVALTAEDKAGWSIVDESGDVTLSGDITFSGKTATIVVTRTAPTSFETGSSTIALVRDGKTYATAAVNYSPTATITTDSSNKFVFEGPENVTALKINGTAVDAADYAVTSDDATIAAVEQNGSSVVITPLKAGKATFTVADPADSSKSAKATVTFVDPAAQIGDTYYKTLADAFKAAQNGETIKLCGDVTESINFTGNTPRVDGFELAVDLAGHTWTAASNSSWALRVDYGIVTVKDSFGDGGVTYGKDYAFLVSHIAGNYTSRLVLESGTFTGKTSVVQVGLSGGSGANKKYYGGELVVNGGTFVTVPDEGENYDASGNFRYTLNKLDYSDSAYPGGQYSPSSITVTGGTFINFDPMSNAAEGEGTVFTAEGYESVDKGNGIYGVAPAIHLAVDAIELYPNDSGSIAVSNLPEGYYFKWTYAPSSIVGSGGWDAATGEGRPYAKKPGVGTATFILYSDSAKTQEVNRAVVSVTVKDVAAVVDGTEYSTVQFADAVAAAKNSDNILEVYTSSNKVTLAEGETLKVKAADNRNKGSVVVSVPAATAEHMYAIEKTADPETGVATYTCVDNGAPNVKVEAADGTTTYSATLSFKAGGTTTVLRDFNSKNAAVTVVGAVLNLNGKTVTFNDENYGIFIRNLSKAASLTVKDDAGNGKIVNEGGFALWAADGDSVAVESGEIIGLQGAVYTSGGGTAAIDGGVFKALDEDKTFLLNCNDSNKGTITVNGGMFYGFDPSNNAADGAGTNYVAEGKTVFSGEDAGVATYTVAKAVTVTFDSDGGTEVASVTVPAGTSIKKPGNPTKAGFAFDAWYDGSEKVSFPLEATDDVTLKAGWNAAMVEYTNASGAVSYSTALPNAFNSGTYKLLGDIAVSSRMTTGILAGNVTLDLNGHTLTSTASDYAILLSRAGTAASHKSFAIIDSSDNGGGTLKVKPAANAAIQAQGKYNDIAIGKGVTIDGGCVALLSENQTLTVDGTVNGGGGFAVATNGSSTKNATISISEGAVLTSDVTAMYLPGNEGLKATVAGAVTGATGIEIRAGELTVADGASITATGIFSASPNGSGTTVSGAAVAVSQHTTNLPTSVTVSGGTLTGAKALYEADLQDEVAEGIELAVTGGTFIGAVESANVESFIVGGYFSDTTADAYVPEGRMLVLDAGTGLYTLADIELALDPAEVVGVVGKTGTLAVTINGAAATPEQLGAIELANSDDAVATLEEGTLAFLKAGSTTITATWRGATATATVTVTPDTTLLDAALAIAGALEEDAYTEESWNALESALAGAKAITSASQQADVDAAANALIAAIADLVAPSDLTELKTAIEKAEAIEDIGYIPAGWAALQAAIAAGKALTAENTQADIDAATEAVNKAARALKVAVATYEGDYYPSLSAAISAAKTFPGGTVTLLSDQSLSGIFNRFALGDGQDFTLDLGGHTLAMNGAYFTINGAKLTVANGTVSSTGNFSQEFTVNSGELTIAADAVVNGAGAISPVGIFGPATVNVSGTLTAENSFAVAGNGSAGKGDYTVNINEGALLSSQNAPAIYHPNAGTVNIAGGSVTGATAVYQKSGELNISGGVLHATGKAAGYAYNGNGASSTGDAVVVDTCGYPGGAPVTAISGGTIISDNAAAIGSYAYGDGNEAEKGFITEGSAAAFSDAGDSTMAAIPEGKILVLQEDALYHLADIELALDPAEVAGVVGKTGTLAVTINGTAATAEQLDAIAWASSDEAVFTVTTGTLTFVDAGSATLTVSFRGTEASVAVTVGSDLTELEAAIAAAEALKQADYKTAGWADLAAAVEAGKAITAADPQADAAAAALAIRAAIDSLVAASDLAALKAAIAEAEALDGAKYKSAGLAALAEAVEAGKALTADDAQADIIEATETVLSAIEALEELSDLTALKKAISDAQALAESEYTATSYLPVVKAVIAALPITGEADQDAVDVAAKAINDAIAALVKVADKEALEAAVEAAASLDADSYTAGSWAPVVAALATAQAVLNNPDATQAAVDAAENALTEAVGNLVAKPNLEELEAALTAAAEKAEDAYTPDSWKALAEAVDAGKVLSGEDQQAAIDAAAKAINDAIAALAEKADKSALEEALEAAEAEDISNCTDATAAALSDAVEAAKAVLDDPNATPEQVAAAAQAVNDAIAALAAKADLSRLNKALADAAELDEGAYSNASWAALSEAVAAAAALTELDAQAIVDAAAGVLEAAIDNMAYAVAETDGISYGTLAEAIAAAKPGSTVTLLADVTVSEAIAVSDKAVTLAGEHTVTTTALNAFQLFGADTKLVLSDGVSIESPVGAQFFVQDEAELVIDGAVVSTEGANTPIYGEGGARISVISGTVYSGQAGAIGVKPGTIDISGGSVYGGNGAAVYGTGPSSEVYVSGDDTEVMGATEALRAADGCEMAVSGGTVFGSIESGWEDDANPAKVMITGGIVEGSLSTVGDSTIEILGSAPRFADNSGNDVAEYAEGSYLAFDEEVGYYVLKDLEAAFSEEAIEATIGSAAVSAPTLLICGNEAAAAELAATVFASSDEAVFTIGDDGTLSLLAVGSATLTATFNGVTAAVTVKVVPDTALLDAAVAIAKTLDEGAYTADSWSALFDALAAAESLGDDAAQEQVNAAADALIAAVAGLAKKSNLEELEAALTAAAEKAEDAYTPDSWKALAEAVEAGKLLSGEDQQVAIDAAAKAINDAIAALAEKADKSALEEALEAAEAEDTSNCTDATAAALSDAVEAAKAVLDDPNATPEQVAAAAQAVNDAIAALEEKPAEVDKAALEQAVDTANDKANGRWMPDSASALEEALDAAKAVLANSLATQEEVDAANEALMNAIDNLDRWLFDDVKNPSSWYFDWVYEAVDRGLMSGYADTNFFGPNDTITRGQVATILYRAAGSPEIAYSGAFKDVKDGQYYSAAVEWAAANGIVTGYIGTGTFKPNNNVTRQELMVMLARYAKFQGGDTSHGSAWKNISDSGKVASWALDAVAWGVDNDIIGSSGKINPAGSATRAEATKMILVAIDAVG